MSEGVELIAAERRRQIADEGWTADHDISEHKNGSLALAASLYAAGETLYRVQKTGTGYKVYDPWPWDPQYDKRRKHSRRRQLEIAGALIAAELDRMIRDNR